MHGATCAQKGSTDTGAADGVWAGEAAAEPVLHQRCTEKESSRDKTSRKDKKGKERLRKLTETLASSGSDSEGLRLSAAILAKVDAKDGTQSRNELLRRFLATADEPAQTTQQTAQHGG